MPGRPRPVPDKTKGRNRKGTGEGVKGRGGGGQCEGGQERSVRFGGEEGEGEAEENLLK